MRWDNSNGELTLQKLVRLVIPRWPRGAREWQLPVLIKTLNREHTITMAPTRGGKSAPFFLSVLIHLQMRKSPNLCSGRSYTYDPLAIIVLPLNAIAKTLVCLGRATHNYASANYAFNRRQNSKNSTYTSPPSIKRPLKRPAPRVEIYSPKQSQQT